MVRSRVRRISLAASGAMLLLSVDLARADCADAVVAAFEAMRKAGPYRSRMVTQAPAGFIETETIAAWPEGMRTTTRGNGVASGIVVLGDRVWQDEGEGAGFVALPAERAGPIAAATRARSTTPPTKPQKATCVGEEEKDGQKFTVYEYERPLKVGGQDGVTHARLSVDPVSKVPRRMMVTSTAMGIMSLSHITITYDRALRVEAPEVGPTKPAPPAAPATK
jgi:hypothetical protein